MNRLGGFHMGDVTTLKGIYVDVQNSVTNIPTESKTDTIKHCIVFYFTGGNAIPLGLITDCVFLPKKLRHCR